jgi:hypothetical protein
MDDLQGKVDVPTGGTEGIGLATARLFDTVKRLEEVDKALPLMKDGGSVSNVLATPHLGYVSSGLYKIFYEDTVANVRQWLDTQLA